MRLARFAVQGDPVPQGSTRAFKTRPKVGKGKVVTTNDPTGRIERWRGDVRQACKLVLPDGYVPTPGPVTLTVLFLMQRPASHYLPETKSRAPGLIRATAPTWHAGSPDIDKLVRAVMDALTNVVYKDDGQVVGLQIGKRWADEPGARIDVRTAPA